MIQKIGIAMAAYAPPAGIFHEQLQSIQKQTFQNWVCVVTCDSPLAELPELASDIRNDPRWIWVENPTRLGHKKNFEKAIQLAAQQGVDAIACSDQDDVWYPEKLTVLADALSKAGKLSLVHSDMHVLVDGKVQLKSTWEIEHRGVHNSRPEHLLVRNVVAGCAMLFDVELARRFPVIPEGAEYHDHWYALVASFHGGVYPVHQPLFAYRQHGTNTVGVTPFYRTFYMPPTVDGPVSFFKKCRAGWKKSLRLARSARAAGLQLSLGLKSTFLSGWDLGLGILTIGLRNYRNDPPLARACIARAIGKALFFLS